MALQSNRTFRLILPEDASILMPFKALAEKAGLIFEPPQGIEVPGVLKESEITESGMQDAEVYVLPLDTVHEWIADNAADAVILRKHERDALPREEMAKLEERLTLGDRALGSTFDLAACHHMMRDFDEGLDPSSARLATAHQIDSAYVENELRGMAEKKGGKPVNKNLLKDMPADGRAALQSGLLDGIIVRSDFSAALIGKDPTSRSHDVELKKGIFFLAYAMLLTPQQSRYRDDVEKLVTRMEPFKYSPAQEPVKKQSRFIFT